MRGCHDDIGRTVLEQRLGCLHDGAAGVDHVVDQNAYAIPHIADDLEHLDLIGHVGIAALVDDRQRRTEDVGPALCHAHATRVRGHHGDAVTRNLLGHMARQERHREQVVDGTVEEALNLRGVQVNRHEAVGTRGLEEIGDESSRDRLATTVLLVLPRVAVERDDHGDALGRGALEGVDHDELLHDPRVDRCGVALQHEAVAATHGFLEAHKDLAVGEVVGLSR